MQMDFAKSIRNMMKMYLLLRQNGLMKIVELQSHIDADDRTMRRYAKALQSAGLPVESKTGKYGGYWLNEPEIDSKDWEILESSLSHSPELIEKLKFRLLNTL